MFDIYSYQGNEPPATLFQTIPPYKSSGILATIFFILNSIKIQNFDQSERWIYYQIRNVYYGKT